MKRIYTVIIAVLVMNFLVIGPAINIERVWAADNYPTRSIRIICPAGVGGGSDTISREVATQLSQILGVIVVVSNLPGSGGLAAMSQFLNKPADGYTLMQQTVSQLQWVYGKKAKFKMPQQIEPLVRLQYVPSTLFMYPKAPWSDAKGMLGHIKKNPGKVRIAVFDPGYPESLPGDLLKRDGYDVKNIVYAKPGERYSAVMGGHDLLLYEQLGDIAGIVEAKKVIPVLHLGDTRHPFLPDVVSTGELGLKGYGTAALARGLWIKNGVPEERRKILLDAFSVMIKTRAWKNFMKEQNLDAQSSFMGPEAYLTWQKEVADAYGF